MSLQPTHPQIPGLAPEAIEPGIIVATGQGIPDEPLNNDLTGQTVPDGTLNNDVTGPEVLDIAVPAPPPDSPNRAPVVRAEKWSCEQIAISACGFTLFSGMTAGMTTIAAHIGSLLVKHSQSQRPAQAGAVGGALLSLPIFLLLLKSAEFCGRYGYLEDERHIAGIIIGLMGLVILTTSCAALLGNEFLNATMGPDPETNSVDLLIGTSIAGAIESITIPAALCFMMNV